MVAASGAIQGKRILVVEGGLTLTHGEMAFGAGWVADQRVRYEPQEIGLSTPENILRGKFGKIGSLYVVGSKPTHWMSG